MSQGKVRQLSETQLKAAQALASGMSQGKAAEVSGASRRSVVRWLTDPVFCQKLAEFSGEIQQVKVEVLRETTREFNLENLIPKALSVVGEVLSDGDERTANKLKACTLIGNWVGMRSTSTSENEGGDGFPGNAFLREREENRDHSEIPEDLSKLSDEELKALYFKSLSENCR
jgi:hypothetical protein